MKHEDTSNYEYRYTEDIFDITKKIKKDYSRIDADFLDYCKYLGMKKLAHDILSFTHEINVYDKDGEVVPFESWFWSNVIDSRVPARFSISFVLDMLRPVLEDIYRDNIRRYRDKNII